MFKLMGKKIVTILHSKSFLIWSHVFTGDEPGEEMGDNLKHVEIPADVQEQFNKDDELEKAQRE